jgi:hypothetical protein
VSLLCLLAVIDDFTEAFFADVHMRGG